MSGVLRVVGMEIFTSNEVEALNGTEVRLKCTFKSKHPVSHSSVAVSWNFRPLSQGAEESVGDLSTLEAELTLAIQGRCLN